VAALEVLSMESIVTAAYVTWRYFDKPSTGWLIASGFCVAGAMLTKQIAVVMPLVVVVHAMLKHGDEFRRGMNEVFKIGLVTAVALWVLTLFNFAKPSQYTPLISGVYEEKWGFVSDVVNPILERRWPAGVYIGSLFDALSHARLGHSAYLLGQYSSDGWWYYFPVVATYKVPLGIMAIILLAVISTARRRTTRDEWALSATGLVVAAFIMGSRLSTGFRHALAPYAIAMMFAGRIASSARMLRGVAWAGVVAALISVIPYHPDYIAYFNRPIDRPYLRVSDSNVDWAQAVKQVRDWLALRPRDGQPIHVGLCVDPFSQTPNYYLPRDVNLLYWLDDVPKSGLLLVSTEWICQPYDPKHRYRWLGDYEPIETIGHTMLVYDLDRLPYHVATKN
jgi:4-amino-4-deoxy-L-arabinose transferase-like glycosyltransferase